MIAMLTVLTENFSVQYVSQVHLGTRLKRVLMPAVPYNFPTVYHSTYQLTLGSKEIRALLILFMLFFSEV